MENEEQKDPFKKLNEVKREVTALKTELNQIDEKKEEWFKKKEEYGNQIRGSIRNIKEAKEKRNSMTTEVKEDKKRRDDLNKEVKDKISESQELRKEKDKISKKFDIREDPSIIKEQIEKLEFRIETEGISFEKEKQLMEVIKGLKKRYKEAEKISDVWDKTHEKSKEINQTKKQAEDLHRNILKR